MWKGKSYLIQLFIFLRVLRDPPYVFTKAHSLLTELLGIGNFGGIEAVALRQVCEAVSTRAAHLAGAGNSFAL